MPLRMIFRIYIVFIPMFHCFNYSNMYEITYAASEEFMQKCIVVLTNTKHSESDKSTLISLTKYLTKGIWGRYPLQTVSLPFTKYGKYYSPQEFSGKTCYRSFNLLLYTDVLKNDLIRYSKRTSLAKALWLIFANETDSFEDIRIPLNSKFYVIIKKTDEQFSVIRIYRTQSNYPTRVDEMGIWSRATGFRMTTMSMLRDRGDLKGQKLITGSAENWPIVSFDEGEAGKKRTIDGYIAALWFELENILNFTSINHRSVDGFIGIETADGGWNGLVGMLQRGEIDAIVQDLNLTPERLSVVDNLFSVFRTRYRIYYSTDSFVSNWLSVFQPFAPSVWIALLVWAVISAIAMYLCSALSIRTERSFDTSRSPIRSFFFVLQALSMQGSNQVPRIWASRIIFVSCYLVSSVILPCYSASLISSITRKTPSRPYTNIHEVIAAKQGIHLIENSVEYAFFKMSNDTINKKVFSLLVPTYTTSYLDGQEELYRKMCKSKIAVFMLESAMDLFVRKLKVCQPSTLDQPIAVIQQSIGLGKDGPYKELFSWNILRMREFGVEDRMYEKYMNTIVEKPKLSTPEVSVADTANIFLCLFLGHLLAAIILFMERAVSYAYYYLVHQ